MTAPGPERTAALPATPVDGHRTSTVPRLVSDLLRWTETVAVPLGAVSGLLVFFGSTHSRAYFGYFGVDQRLLQYSVQDQVLRSADVMFGTAVLVLSVVLVLVGLDRLLALLGRRTDRLGRGVAVAPPAAGLALLGVGLVSALRLPLVSLVVPLRAAAVLFVAGAMIMLSVGSRSGRRAGRTLLLAALVLGAFWITTLYAETEGRVLAQQVDDAPAHLPLVTLYSSTYVDLPGLAVVVSKVASPTGTPLYRYTGLRLLAFSNDRWFLITGRREAYRSTVAIVANDGSIRAEIARQAED